MKKEIKKLGHELEGKVFKAFMGKKESVIMSDDFGKIIIVKNPINVGHAKVTKVIKEAVNCYVVYAENVEPTDIYPEMPYSILKDLLLNKFNFKLGWEHNFDYSLGGTSEINFLFYNVKYPCIIHGDTIYGQNQCNSIDAFINYKYFPISTLGCWHSGPTIASIRLNNSSSDYPLQTVLDMLPYTEKMYAKNTFVPAYSYEESDNMEGRKFLTIIGDMEWHEIPMLTRLARLPEDFFSMFVPEHDYHKIKGVDNILIDRDKIKYLHWHRCRDCGHTFAIESLSDKTLQLENCPKCNSDDIRNNDYIVETLK